MALPCRGEIILGTGQWASGSSRCYQSCLSLERMDRRSQRYDAIRVANCEARLHLYARACTIQLLCRLPCPREKERSPATKSEPDFTHTKAPGESTGLDLCCIFYHCGGVSVLVLLHCLHCPSGLYVLLLLAFVKSEDAKIKQLKHLEYACGEFEQFASFLRPERR